MPLTDCKFVWKNCKIVPWAEATFCVSCHNLTESPAGNLFLVGGKRLFTNDQESRILLGITRDTVIHLANDLGIGTFVQKLTLADLRDAEEAFLTDTAAEITPVATVDMNLIGNEYPAESQLCFRMRIRRRSRAGNSRYNDWLTH